MDRNKKNRMSNKKIVFSSLTITSLSAHFFFNPLHALTIPLLRTQLQGSYVSNSTNFMVDLDSLLPLKSSSNNFLFTNVQGRLAQGNSWLLGPGVLLRHIHQNQLVGVYGFAEYKQTNPKAQFLVFNPGLEWMSPFMDIHLNGYIPAKSRQETTPPIFASSIGNYNYVHFYGHTQWDELFANMVTIGKGTDIEAGYSFNFKGYRGRVYSGAYLYQSSLVDTKSIKGGLFGVQLPLNKYADVLITNSYNNLTHNSIALTLRANWGAERRFSKDIRERLLDRVERHNGIIQSGAGALAQSSFSDTGRKAISNTNIWFFAPDTPGSSNLSEPYIKESCTYEHPCTHFNQTSMNVINSFAPQASFYLKPGTYNFSQQIPLNINQGQSIYGRSSNYTRPALGTERPLFHGALVANGSNKIDSIRVFNDDIITIDSASNSILSALSMNYSIGTQGVHINNVELIANALDNRANFTIALSAQGGNILLTNSKLISNNFSTDPNSVAYGIVDQYNSIISSQNNEILAHSESGIVRNVLVSDNASFKSSLTYMVATSKGSASIGVMGIDKAKIILHQNVIDSQITEGLGEAVGILLANTSQSIVDASQIKVRSTGASSYGVSLSESSTLALNSSAMESQITSGTGTGYGLFLVDDSQMNVDHSQLKIQTWSGDTFGAHLFYKSKLILKNSFIKSLTLNNEEFFQGEAYGILAKHLASVYAVNNTIKAENSGFDATGIFTQTGGTIYLDYNHVQATSNQGGSVGISCNNVNQITTITNSEIKSLSKGTSAIGIKGLNNYVDSYMVVKNTIIDSQVTEGLGVSQGLELGYSSKTSISQSTIKAHSSGSSIGASLKDGSTLNIRNSIVESLALQGSATGFTVSEYSKLSSINNVVVVKSNP